MAASGWYGDPTRQGRLRYWDGSSWTEHVSEGGGTASDPIVGVPPAPPAVTPPPAPAPAVAAPPQPAEPGAGASGAGRRADYPATPLGRAGFGVAALGGILGAASAGSTAVEQEGLARITVSGGSWIGVVGAVLCVAAAAAPWPWARLAGVGVSSLFALLLAFALIGFRTSEDLVAGVDVSLGPAGWLMLLGSVLLFAGTALALVGLRRPATGFDPEARPRDGKAVASLVLGITGLLIPVTAAPAVGLALFAMDDTRATGGRVGGRGLAIAGLVLGIVSLSLWGLGLLLGMLLAQP
jgi:hypothetical protein